MSPWESFFSPFRCFKSVVREVLSRRLWGFWGLESLRRGLSVSWRRLGRLVPQTARYKRNSRSICFPGLPCKGVEYWELVAQGRPGYLGSRAFKVSRLIILTTLRLTFFMRVEWARDVGGGVGSRCLHPWVTSRQRGNSSSNSTIYLLLQQQPG